MPLINVQTSISEIGDSNLLLKELSNQLAGLTGKPEQYVMTLLQTNVPMTFGGTEEPCCYIEVKSIGSLNPSEMSAVFCKLVANKTGISPKRIYIGFDDVPARLWGWDGRTFG
ncbi:MULTISPECIES: phenylpyruvate tautomerase MIF-related protein [unclassified Prochlorococcus]|uniref:phenylpyruvate tautomerase MIF-related protein n=1 Tax=unclassified Prochlorococcus TaxID=2627481 RepID=UPI0005338EC5|nr:MULTISPECIES: phenylpyruvate tautomerase MIF-related protein [unclassified Prochlorococcus]KGG15531.1 putative ATLS1-like light-inducible protein [Prochlorococcus sp. MIT 0602]KGG17811.1 putative ATLS1-like light-inducible protein [Prochlorococcus sp. MIT 0603]